MKVNVGKTKVMVFERGDSTTECDILIEGENVEQLKEFVHLDSLFTDNGKHDRDIERRVNAGNIINGASITIMNSKSISRQARLAIYNEVLIPKLNAGGAADVNYMGQPPDGKGKQTFAEPTRIFIFVHKLQSVKVA
ncbi:hypothetical protein EVAR_97988_1 [Eumeta japonica]|uniref:Uncharacterized protein n=1 Tax=Eumeta variegata TaxID=151549 RepID=A0A4C1WM28_EUMVA|nr:hypothetical protein EVAR_97988_1 [Eumeta japonica]